MGVRRPDNYLFGLADYLLTMDCEQVIEAAAILWQAHSFGDTIFACGNGGSAATASHFIEDIQKAAGLRAISLSDSPALITAHGNDNGYEQVFAQQLNRLFRQGDVLCVFSGSGNSPNVVEAAKTAKAKGGQVIFFGGGNGGAMRTLSDYHILAPTANMQWIEDIHLALSHAIYVELMKRKHQEEAESANQPKVN